MKSWKIILPILSIIFFVIGYAIGNIPTEMFTETPSIIAVILIAMPAFYGLWKMYGNRALWIITAVGLFALSIETIGIHTGFPYSHFEYTMPFGYRLFSTTPWTVFIAWSPLVIGAYVLVQSWFKQWWSRLLVYLGILVATDIVLDPGAVARGLWEYTNGGLWFDVPIQNFLGWVFSGAIAYCIIKFFLKNNHSDIHTDTKTKKYILISSLSLILTIFQWSGVNIGYHMYLPGVIGIILGSILIFGILILHNKNHS